MERSALPPPSRLETLLELLSLAGLATGFLLLLALWPQLPAQVPAHFDASGRVTRFSSKTSLWWLQLTNVGLYLLLTALNRFPKLWNLPGEGDARQFALARAFVRAFKTSTVWLFVYLLWNTLQVALGKAGGLAWWFLPAGLFGPILLLIIWLVAAHAPPQGRS